VPQGPASHACRSVYFNLSELGWPGGDGGGERQIAEQPPHAGRRFLPGQALPGEVEISPPGAEADHDDDQPDGQGKRAAGSLASPSTTPVRVSPRRLRRRHHRAAARRRAQPFREGPSGRLAEAAYLGSIVTGDLRDAPRLLEQVRRAHSGPSGPLSAAVAGAYHLLHGDDGDTAHRLLTTAIDELDDPATRTTKS
jgi:hypothetical protein